MAASSSLPDPTATIGIAPPFPVVWPQAGDELIAWQLDRFGCPTAVPALAYEFLRSVYDGFDAGFRAFGLPARMATRHINGWLCQALLPTDGAQATRSVEQVAEQLGALWEAEWLPAARVAVASCRLTGDEAAPAELLDRLERAFEALAPVWEAHFLVVLPQMLAISQFEEFYAELFGAGAGVETLRLLQGFDTKTLETDRALWQLSRFALADDVVADALRSDPASAAHEALHATSGGRAFLARLDTFLVTYGHRADEWELSMPRWWENPTTPLATIQGFLSLDGRGPAERLASQAAERERRLAADRERLRAYPLAVVSQFEQLLNAAQVASWISEEHAYWMDYAGADAVRRVAVALGRSLAGTALRGPDEVFLFSLEELRAVVSGTAPFDVGAEASARADDLARFRRLTPPVTLGAEPIGADDGDDPLSLAMTKFFGAPVAPSDSANEVRGHPGAPGVARGVARVAPSLAEAALLRAGEVLVTSFTLPAWTPLFATAAAVVTDFGGVLSHCAVVAREYGIPAVVGCGNATAAIATGQYLEVDGALGVVRIVTAG